MPENLKPLTSLRFIAAMWVVSYHFWPDLGLMMPAMVSKGYLGVELFFVLSGFILSHVYLERYGAGRFSYSEFLWARLARIYPVHLVTLTGLGALAVTASALGVQMNGRVLVWPSLPAQLSLTQAWGFALHGGWNHPSWSISAEWFAYLSFPAFAWTAWRFRTRPILAVALAVIAVIALELSFERLAGFPLTRATIAWGALRIVPCFLLGCATYLLWSQRGMAGARTALLASAASASLIAMGAGFGAPDWAMIVLFGMLLYALASLSSAGGRTLTGALWVYLGEVSFAVYMVCIPWQLVFGKVVQRLSLASADGFSWWLWSAELVGVVPVAMLVHHLVERPAREVMRSHGVPFQRAPSRLQRRIAALAAVVR